MILFTFGCSALTRPLVQEMRNHCIELRYAVFDHQDQEIIVTAVTRRGIDVKAFHDACHELSELAWVS